MDIYDPAAKGPPALPLAGVRILELGMVFVLPYAILPLATLGADVIKVEARQRPDSVRWGPPPGNQPRADGFNHGGHFRMLNRNKRGITLNLAHPRGRDLLLQLVKVSDVVAENFTPRVLRNFGLEYEKLRAVNERIILLSSSGFGQTGPWRDYRAYGPNTEAVDGLMHLTGYPDGPPTRAGAGGLGVAFTDVAGAFYGTYAILAALEYRERTGLGQWLDLSHYEAGAATIPEAILDFTMNQRVMGRAANRHPSRAPQGCYPCDGDDRWVAISIATDAQFGALAAAMSKPDLATDKRFATVLGRRRHHDEIDRVISSWTRSRDATAVEHELQVAGIDATSVATLGDVWVDPQLRHRGTFELLPPPPGTPEIGPRAFLRPGLPNPGSVTRTEAPRFGQHTREVLRELLGIQDDELAELQKEGIIADSPAPGVLARTGPMDLPDMIRTGRMRAVDPDYQARLEAWFSSEE